MPVCFTHLKISGFKSFADSISLDILPGLTGIVGPNGCGKSNIVEAIRWAMGESSARSLRGGEMDDVIFAGTTRRAPYNVAEVNLILEHITENQETGEITPSHSVFQKQQQIQISRQIERGTGSQYRLNGKMQRARDIQTLFADFGSGPRSSTIISQNRISQLIAATPEERKQVLEEAAGISGLHNRRREAELKLKATEENLARLDDLKQQLEILTAALQQQSIQAGKYRSLSAALRENEQFLQILHFKRAMHHLALCQQKVVSAQQGDHERQLEVGKIQAGLEKLSFHLPEIRQKETQSRIQWDHQRQTIQSLKNQQHQTQQEIGQLTERLDETQTLFQTAALQIQKIQTDQQTIQDQLTTIDAALATYPIQKSEMEASINQSEKEMLELNRVIQDTEQELEHQKTLYQNQSHTLEAAKRKKTETEQNHRLVKQQYDECMQHLPSDEQLKQANETAIASHHALKAIESHKQQLENKLQEARLENGQLTYQLQQAKEKFATLEQGIQDKIQQEDKLTQEYSRIETQIQELQKQLFLKTDQETCLIQLKQTEKSLSMAKAEVETALNNHHKAIKDRLEQESMFSQATQSYENTIHQHNLANNELQQAQQTFQTLSRQKEDIQARFIQPEAIIQKETDFRTAETLFNENELKIEALSQDCQLLQDTLATHQNALNQHMADISLLKTKQDGLEQILMDPGQVTMTDSLPAILDHLSPPEEWIPVLAAIFDDTLEAPEQTNMQKGWVTLNRTCSTFPAPVQKLSTLLSVPPALQRAFDHIGIVPDHETGNSLSSDLTPGQILATQQGDIWRWDGYYQTHAVQGRATQRLLQKQTLKQIKTELKNLYHVSPVLENKVSTLQKQIGTVKDDLSKTQSQQKTYKTRLQEYSEQFFTLQNKAKSLQSQWEALTPAFQQAQDNLHAKETRLQQMQQAASMPRPDQQQVANTQKQEIQQKEKLEQARQNFQHIETEFLTLKDQYQKRLHHNEQTLIRLDGLNERKRQLENDQETLHHLLVTDQQALHQFNAIEDLSKKITHIQNEIHNFHTELKHNEANCLNAHQTLTAHQQAHQTLKERSIQQKSRLETLNPQCQALEQAMIMDQEQLQKAEQALQSFPDYSPLEQKYQTLSHQLTRLKETHEKRQLDYHLLINKNETFLKEHASLKEQYQNWNAHQEERRAEQNDIQERISRFQGQIKQLTLSLPDFTRQLQENEAREQELSAAYAELQKELAVFEQDKNQLQQSLHDAEQQKNRSYEQVLKAQAKEEQANALLEQIRHSLSTETEALSSQQESFDISDQHEKRLKSAIETLTTDREALGAVNLRAELEFQEKQEQLTHLETEYNELMTAIQQLNESIQKLNQQGRHKLNTVFQEVNEHFQDLFTRMFNGGHAYLKLIPHEDPLRSGLEIYAQPPGKKLSTLSLLSGGEQALTALSLVFAIGRCNPVPICILDEVDAPLDDPNVERFCTLLSDMTQQAGTRFLVVTHHQLTMSHMNRLYGVTMQERGVSQIISIDLERAVQLQQNKHREQLDLI